MALKEAVADHSLRTACSKSMIADGGDEGALSRIREAGVHRAGQEPSRLPTKQTLVSVARKAVAILQQSYQILLYIPEEF